MDVRGAGGGYDALWWVTFCGKRIHGLEVSSNKCRQKHPQASTVITLCWLKLVMYRKMSFFHVGVAGYSCVCTQTCTHVCALGKARGHQLFSFWRWVSGGPKRWIRG